MSLTDETPSTRNLFFFLFFFLCYHFPLSEPISMKLPFPAIFLIFIFFLPSSTTGAGIDTIFRLIRIQDRERAPPSVQEAAARGVLLRLLPSHSSSFEFRILSKVSLFFYCYCCCLVDSWLGNRSSYWVSFFSFQCFVYDRSNAVVNIASR